MNTYGEPRGPLEIVGTEMAKIATHESRKRRCQHVIDVFRNASYVPNLLECVKHRVAEEEVDFKDMTDLIRRMRSHPSHQSELMRLLQLPSPLPVSNLYSTLVLSDLDNTAIENPAVCPVHYTPHDVVPGFIPIVRALTHDGATTLTFISARPASLERLNIIHIRKLFVDRGMPPAFSFQSGEIEGTLFYSASVATRSKALLLKAANLYASVKFRVYLQLVAIFPHARIVFFGDDTQGDYLFASQFVQHRPPGWNFAFIRRISHIPVVPAAASAASPPTAIVYHSSYYEAIVRAPCGVFSNIGDREAAAALAIEEYHRHYIPAAAAGSFADVAAATSRDMYWIGIIQNIGRQDRRLRFFSR